MGFVPLLEVTPGPEPRTLGVAGELDSSSVDALTVALVPLLQSDGDVVLDVGDLSFIDSTGIHLLVSACLDLQGRGSVVLHRPQRMVLRVLEVAGLDHRLPNLVLTPSRVVEAAPPAVSVALSVGDGHAGPSHRAAIVSYSLEGEKGSMTLTVFDDHLESASEHDGKLRNDSLWLRYISAVEVRGDQVLVRSGTDSMLLSFGEEQEAHRFVALIRNLLDEDASEPSRAPAEGPGATPIPLEGPGPSPGLQIAKGFRFQHLLRQRLERVALRVAWRGGERMAVVENP